MVGLKKIKVLVQPDQSVKGMRVSRSNPWPSLNASTSQVLAAWTCSTRNLSKYLQGTHMHDSYKIVQINQA